MTLWQRLTYPFRRQRQASSAARQPSRSEMGQEHPLPIGFEATDMSLIDQVSRRNDALERTNLIDIPRHRNGYRSRRSTYVAPMPDDETYAARFHRAFNKRDHDT